MMMKNDFHRMEQGTRPQKKTVATLAPAPEAPAGCRRHP